MVCSNCRSISHASDDCLYEPVTVLHKAMAGHLAIKLIEQGKFFEAKPHEEFYSFLVIKESRTRDF